MATIKSTELRIGNYVLMRFPYSSKEYVVSILTLSNEALSYPQDKCDLIVNIDTPNFALYGPQKISLQHLSPIPLTEELLLKAGFTEDLAFPKTPHFSLVQKSKNKFFLAINREQVSDLQVRSLHQLQNLYYALHEKELKLNLHLLKQQLVAKQA